MSGENIRVPDSIDFSGERVAAGDTIEFLQKMSRQQAKLEVFSAALNDFASDLQVVAAAAEYARDQARAIAGFSGDYADLVGLPDLDIYFAHTGGTVTDYRESTSTDPDGADLDFAVGNVAVRDLSAPAAFVLKNMPVAGSFKFELILTSNGQPVDWSGIAGLVWEPDGQPPTLNTMDRIVFSKYESIDSIFAICSRVI